MKPFGDPIPFTATGLELDLVIGGVMTVFAVELEVDSNCWDPDFSAINEVSLTGPTGTKSVFVRPIRECREEQDEPITATEGLKSFWTRAHWGELSNGTWHLSIA